MPPRRRNTAATNSAEIEDSKFDLDSWLTGGRPITASLRITNKLHLVERIDLLAEEAKATAEEPAGERRVSDGPAPDPTEEYKALVREYLDSFQEFVFRGRLPGDWEEIGSAMRAVGKTVKDINLANIYATAHFSVEPKLTVEAIQQMIPIIGAPQWDRMVACWSAIVNGVVEPTAPLSPGHSRGR